MKTHYDLLGLQPSASADDVKRAFRREIARYHPDKVQHLGTEFQEIAATRAAALTEAYRVLMDVELRERYDDALDDDEALPPPARSAAQTPQRAAGPAAPAGEPAPPPPPPDRRFAKDQASSTDFVRRAVAAKLKNAVEGIGGTVTSAPFFDSVFQIKGRKGLFRKADASVKLAVRIVPRVDAAAVTDAWTPALRLTAVDETLCLMLLGSGVDPARELSMTVSDLRKKSRKVGPVVIPVDVRDWEALFPPETPESVRALLERLRQGN
ncbi:MAG: J domain-containing protein [Vicinamibacterales bacterium]